MSLAFALVAAINGSTGSRATLSYGLYWDQASSASARRREDSHGSGVAAQAARVADLKIGRSCRFGGEVHRGRSMTMPLQQR